MLRGKVKMKPEEAQPLLPLLSGSNKTESGSYRIDAVDTDDG
jgi:hypothetical protein